MNKQEWLAQFEAITGRTATAEEIAQALEAGKFQEVSTKETHVEQTPVQEKPVQTTEAASTQAAPAAPAQPSEFQKTMSSYWKWLIAAWKNPTAEGTLEPKHAYLAFGTLTLFYTLTIFIAVYQAGRALTGGINRAANLFSTNSSNAFQMSNPVDFSTFFTILIAAALYLFSIVLGGFVVKRMIYQNTSFTFTRAFDYYAKLFSINIILTALASICAPLNIVTFAAFLFIVSLFIFTVGTIFSIAQTEGDSKMDSFYRFLLAVIVNGIILVIFFYAEMSLVAEYISKLFRF